MTQESLRTESYRNQHQTLPGSRSHRNRAPRRAPVPAHLAAGISLLYFRWTSLVGAAHLAELRALRAKGVLQRWLRSMTQHRVGSTWHWRSPLSRQPCSLPTADAYGHDCAVYNYSVVCRLHLNALASFRDRFPIKAPRQGTAASAYAPVRHSTLSAIDC